MTLTLVDLDQTTRDEMVREVDDDAASGRLYLSDRLSRVGRSAYSALLRDAVAHHDEGWLAVQLSPPGVMNTHEPVVRRGRMVSARIPHDATTTLAEGEFNRFYLRGLCRRALAEGGRMIEVYRARPVREPRPQSVALIGHRLAPEQLLLDLRTQIGVDTILGLPSGPNSGLSGKLA